MGEYKNEILESGRKLVERDLTSGTGGNISFYDRENEKIWITPSGIDFNVLKEEDLVAIDINGNIIEGSLKPSSEWIMHTYIYRSRKDVNSIIHGHTIYSTVLSILRTPLLASHYMIGVAGKTVEIAEYATYGTKELAVNAVKALKGNNAVLLANHGIIAVGKDVNRAFNVLEQVEYCSKLSVISQSIGRPYILSDGEMDLVLEKFKLYGQ